jgi:hypothetical protein
MRLKDRCLEEDAHEANATLRSYILFYANALSITPVVSIHTQLIP